MSESTPAEGGKKKAAAAFDIRVFIAALIGFYGVVLVLTGLLGTDDAELAKTDGLNLNLWAGLAMVVFAAVFIFWARSRPVVMEEHREDSEAIRDANRPHH